jgi:isocitrate lyase
VNCGVEQGIDRGLSYAPYADLIGWKPAIRILITQENLLKEFTQNSQEKMLAYNCSPSFNWAAKLSVAEMETFREDLAAMGYKFNSLL